MGTNMTYKYNLNSHICIKRYSIFFHCIVTNLHDISTVIIFMPIVQNAIHTMCFSIFNPQQLPRVEETF